MLRAASAAALLLVGLQAAAAPQRVVSLNLCTDQYALLLLPPERIAGLSFLAADPALSSMAGVAAGIPALRGDAEGVLGLGPDLVLADAFSAAATKRILRAAGLAVIEHTPPTDVEGIRRETRSLAKVLGVVSRGEQLLAEMDERLRQIPQRDGRAAFLFPNAFTNGPGTLSDAALKAVGLQNAVQQTGYGPLGVETLLALSPDYLIVPRDRAPSYSQAASTMNHRAVLARWPSERRIAFSGPLLICGTPLFAAAAAELAGR